MDLTDSMSPAIIALGVTLGLAAIGFVVWLVRLESKANAGVAKQEKFEIDVRLELAEQEKKHAQLEKDFWKHVADAKAHHNEQASIEFRAALERRLGEIDYHVKDLGRKMNHIAGRE